MVKKGHGLIIVVLTIRPTQPYLASLVNGKNAVSIFSKIVYTQNPPQLEKYVHFTRIRGYLTDRPLTTRTLNSILANAESCMRSPGLQRLVCMYMYVRTFRGFILSALCASLFQNPRLYSATLKQIFPIILPHTLGKCLPVHRKTISPAFCLILYLSENLTNELWAFYILVAKSRQHASAAFSPSSCLFLKISKEKRD